MRTLLTAHIRFSRGFISLAALIVAAGWFGLATPARAIVVTDVQNDGVTTAAITAALQGTAVTISNLVITNNGCNVNPAIGLFDQGTTPTGPGPVLGDVSGVVMGTGPLKPANALVSPNNVSNWTNGLCGAAVNDADMVALEPATNVGEYVAIEFDVVPTQPIMVIPFQFGSDEFPEYVCSAFNDIAGIFVSGPGIAGPYSGGAENYAKTPGGDLTSINWVNTGVIGNQGNIANCGSLANTAYYTDNSNGDPNGGNATVATTNANLELDGWTNYVYQPINVIPGQTYHVKAAIADAGDRQWDSAIFFHLIFSTSALTGFDFGDAPDTYQTLTASGGPRHAINSNIFLGTVQPDNEVTGQPSAAAQRDDTTGSDDEDGVAFFPLLRDSATSYSVGVTVNNTTGTAANLIGWIDFNRNGTFEASEGRSVAVANGTVGGTATLTWNGLGGLVGGATYARFRLTTDPTITIFTPGESANDGEVEDYPLDIVSLTPAAGNKPLYLGTNSLSRLVPGPLGNVTVNEGATVNWTLAPALATDLTVDGGSGQIPVTLVLSELDTGDLRSYTISLSSSDAGVGTFATLNVVNEDLNPPVTLTYNLNLTSPGDKILPAGSTIILSITNNTTGSGNRRVLVDPNGSYVNLPSKTVVNVDTIAFYDADYGTGGSPVAAIDPGGTVYIRATVSDPFGSFDITSADITIYDPSGTPVVASAAMIEVFNSGTDHKIYEYPYTVPLGGPTGDWSIQVKAAEGTEGTVTHTGLATLPVVGQPLLTILKSASGPTANPGDLITYTLQIQNTGAGPATTVVATDHLSAYTQWQLDFGSGAPFSWAPGTSGLTFDQVADVEYSTDDGVGWGATPTSGRNAPAGFDGDITNWRINMQGSMPVGASFSLQYRVRVE